MALRPDQAVLRGEIDNRARGRVTGRIWFVEREEPVVLALEGDCHRDLAGRRLEFTNPQPAAHPHVDRLVTQQHGRVGDITAAIKRCNAEFSLEQIREYLEADREFPNQWGNMLHLEWFGPDAAHVIIESGVFELRIIGEPAWEMTPDEEAQQKRANGQSFCAFMDRMELSAGRRWMAESAAKEAAAPHTKSEAEAEARQARSDLLADRIQARLEREGETADYEKILAEELARLRRERDEPEPTPEQLARNEEHIEELNAAAEAALANPDFNDTERREHPLAQCAAELATNLRQSAQQQGWLPPGTPEEHPLVELLSATEKAAAKLGGALNPRPWPPELEASAGIIISLTLARTYLEDAARALESCHEENLIPSKDIGPLYIAVALLAQDVAALIIELREQLKNAEG